MIVDFVWQRLLYFDTESGDSRVFFENALSSTDVDLNPLSIVAYLNPSSGIFRIKGNTEDFIIDVLDNAGQVFQTYVNEREITIDLSSLLSGLFFVRI
jgi:hypothetical protein